MDNVAVIPNEMAPANIQVSAKPTLKRKLHGESHVGTGLEATATPIAGWHDSLADLGSMALQSDECHDSCGDLGSMEGAAVSASNGASLVRGTILHTVASSVEVELARVDELRTAVSGILSALNYKIPFPAMGGFGKGERIDRACDRLLHKASSFGHEHAFGQRMPEIKGNLDDVYEMAESFQQGKPVPLCNLQGIISKVERLEKAICATGDWLDSQSHSLSRSSNGAAEAPDWAVILSPKPVAPHRNDVSGPTVAVMSQSDLQSMINARVQASRRSCA